ncbi:MAG: hypothetical protein M3R25_09885 [Bacteroidota bacterium]|nr:hypothetical protein [Bacteroidota bacterium]
MKYQNDNIHTSQESSTLFENDRTHRASGSNEIKMDSPLHNNVFAGLKATGGWLVIVTSSESFPPLHW